MMKEKREIFDLRIEGEAIEIYTTVVFQELDGITSKLNLLLLSLEKSYKMLHQSNRKILRIMETEQTNEYRRTLCYFDSERIGMNEYNYYSKRNDVKLQLDRCGNCNGVCSTESTPRLYTSAEYGNGRYEGFYHRTRIKDLLNKSTELAGKNEFYLECPNRHLHINHYGEPEQCLCAKCVDGRCERFYHRTRIKYLWSISQQST